MPDDQHLTKPQIKVRQYETYLAAIRGSVGARMFRHLYATVDGEPQDIVRGGEIACAYYASWILFHFNLIKEPHATVDGLVRDLLDHSGWKREDLSCRRPGAVLEWDKQFQADGTLHGHVGFCTGAYTAISHSAKTHHPDEHEILWDGRSQRLIGVYTHPFLHA
jgi:hypothetical protein